MGSQAGVAEDVQEHVFPVLRVSAAHALLGSTLRISESQAQRGEESAFLTSAQVMFMLWAWGLHFESC